MPDRRERPTHIAHIGQEAALEATMRRKKPGANIRFKPRKLCSNGTKAGAFNLVQTTTGQLRRSAQTGSNELGGDTVNDRMAHGERVDVRRIAATDHTRDGNAAAASFADHHAVAFSKTLIAQG